jgi:hypothetical protein
MVFSAAIKKGTLSGSHHAAEQPPANLARLGSHRTGMEGRRWAKAADPSTAQNHLNQQSS